MVGPRYLHAGFFVGGWDSPRHRFTRRPSLPQAGKRVECKTYDLLYTLITTSLRGTKQSLRDSYTLLFD